MTFEEANKEYAKTRAYELLYTLIIRAYKTDEVLLEAHGITLVCAYNLIKMYGLQKVVLEKEGES